MAVKASFPRDGVSDGNAHNTEAYGAERSGEEGGSLTKQHPPAQRATSLP